MLFAYPTGPQGNVVSKATNELIIPNYKQTWGNIRKIADAPGGHPAPDLQEPGIQAGLSHGSGAVRQASPDPPFACVGSAPACLAGPGVARSGAHHDD